MDMTLTLFGAQLAIWQHNPLSEWKIAMGCAWLAICLGEGKLQTQTVGKVMEDHTKFFPSHGKVPRTCPWADNLKKKKNPLWEQKIAMGHLPT